MSAGRPIFRHQASTSSVKVAASSVSPGGPPAMPPVPYRKRALALAALALLGAACHPNSEISSAPEDRRRPTTPSGGLGNLGGANATPDAGSTLPDPGVKPWSDAGQPGTDTAATMKEDKCAGESQAAKQVPVDLLLLVDRSGSMTYRVSPGGKSKWEMAQDALTTFIKDPKSAGLG